MIESDFNGFAASTNQSNHSGENYTVTDTNQTGLNSDGSSPESNFPYTPIESLESGSFTSLEENNEILRENIAVPHHVKNGGMLDEDELDRQIASLISASSFTDSPIQREGTNTSNSIYIRKPSEIHDNSCPINDMDVDDEFDDLEKVILQAHEDQGDSTVSGNNSSKVLQQTTQQYNNNDNEAMTNNPQQVYNDSNHVQQFSNQSIETQVEPLVHQYSDNSTTRYKRQVPTSIKSGDSSQLHQQSVIVRDNQSVDVTLTSEMTMSPNSNTASIPSTTPPPPPPQENKFLKCFAILKTNYLNLCSAYNSLIVKFNDSEVERTKLKVENEELKSLLDASLHELNYLRMRQRQALRESSISSNQRPLPTLHT